MGDVDVEVRLIHDLLIDELLRMRGARKSLPGDSYILGFRVEGLGFRAEGLGFRV